MSFTNNDILVLARAGFTAQQIGALNSIQTPITTSPVVQTPIQTSTPPVVQTPIQTNNDVLNQILNAIQNNAINQTEQPTQPTTDDILAEIINPPTK